MNAEEVQTALTVEGQLLHAMQAYLNNSSEEVKKQFAGKLDWLNSITSVVYNEKGGETVMELADLGCNSCRRAIPNLLVYLCHLETVHADRLYTFIVNDNVLSISRTIQDPRTRQNKQFPTSFVKTHQRRVYFLLKSLLGKISKFQEESKMRKFYRYDSIFEQAKEDQIDDSDQEVVGDINQTIRERINSIVDVSRTQKELFILWNSYIRAVQTSYGVRRGLNHRDLLEHLCQFMKQPKLRPLRLELVNHFSVLLFFGKISRKDMVQLIVKFDSIHRKAQPV